ncbi:MAG: transposase [Chitinophagales bacterium]
MKEEGYVIRNPLLPHFITFTVVEWIDIFSRKIYRDIVMESMEFCRVQMGLKVHAFVIMSNHMHVIWSNPDGVLHDIVTSFKKFTGRKIIQTIPAIPESRSAWMLKKFEISAAIHKRNSDHQFWAYDNHYKEIYSYPFLIQKLQYIHQNPVKAGIVDEPEHFVYSSARNYAGQFSLFKVDLLDVD